MKKIVFAALCALVATSGAYAKKEKEVAAPSLAETVSFTPTAAFTDSTAAALGTNKRVVISSVVVHLQTATAFTNAGHFLLGKSQANAANADSILRLDGYTTSALTQIGDGLYAKLAADLKAAGYEVLPEEQLKASAAYKDLLATNSISQFSNYANKMGDEVLFGPSSLGLYMPYGYEVGTFQTQLNPLSDKVSAKVMGGHTGSGGPNPPNSLKIDGNWKLPGKEAAIAKELNATVVKASYVITFGKVTGIQIKSTAEVNKVLSERTTTNEVKGIQGDVALGQLPDQTRIAFRLPDGARFQKRSLMKMEPAKDGDVVVRLANSLVQQGEFFASGGTSLETNTAKKRESDNKPRGLMGRLKDELGKGDNISTAMTNLLIADEAAYVAGVVDMVGRANAAMLMLVKQ